jgi:hypothetical protein
MGSPDAYSKTLNAVRSPLVFNALTILVMGGIVGSVLLSGLPMEMKCGSVIFFFSWTVGLTVWVNRKAGTNQRDLAYGPTELLEESRLKFEHDREMAKLSIAARSQS